MMKRGEASICYGAAYTAHGLVTRLLPYDQCSSGHVVLIRGGSQSMRSKIMKHVIQDLLERGYSLEIYRHWLDPNLTSGFRLFSPVMTVLDDELQKPVSGRDALMASSVIDISSALDYRQLQAQKKALCTLAWQTKQRLRIATSYLQEIATILHERKSYVSDSMDFPAVNRVTQQTMTEIFAHPVGATTSAQYSSLFASAITANGLDHCVNPLVSGYKHFYLLRGEPGSGRSTLLARVSEQAAIRGIVTRSFSGPLEPDHLELLLMPALETALIGGIAVSSFRPNDHRSLTSLKVVELGDLMRKKRLTLFQPEWHNSQRRFDDLMELVVKQFAHCKQANDTVTAIYQEYVNHTELVELSEQLLRYALEVIDEKL